MDVSDIRHANLLSLVQAMESRGISKRMDQAQQLGALGSSYLSQLIAGKKMGDDVARKIDEAAGKPRGWMDRVHTSGVQEPPADYASQSVRDVRRIVGLAIRIAQFVNDMAIKPLTPAEWETVTDAATDHLLEVGADRVEADLPSAARQVAAALKAG